VFIHPLSDVKSEQIGLGTKIWQYVIILEKAKIGNNCNINAHCFLENDVELGNNVTVKCGVYIWNGLRIEDDVFIGPNVTFTNDIYPRSKKYPSSYPKTIISKGASIGANSTLLCGISVGKYSLIGAGSVVTKDIMPYSICYGNPCTFKGYICACGTPLLGGDEIFTCKKCNCRYQKRDGILTSLGNL
jgi:acetyltransferase-like isoleucine patch superfamily enzyme